MQGRRTRNAPKLHLSSRLHWAIRLLFVTNWTWRYIVHPSLLCMPFLFGWPPCQRSDMTLVEVSQHAYDYLYIRTIVLFVFLRNSCKPDMVLVYIFCWINFVWVCLSCLSLEKQCHPGNLGDLIHSRDIDQGSLLLTSITEWITSYIHHNVQDEIIYPFPNSNGATVEVWEWIINFIQRLGM